MIGHEKEKGFLLGKTGHKNKTSSLSIYVRLGPAVFHDKKFDKKQGWGMLALTTVSSSVILLGETSLSLANSMN